MAAAMSLSNLDRGGRVYAFTCHPRESGDPACDAALAELSQKLEAAEPYETGFPLSRE
jgi:hypothetical protein